MIAVDLPQYNDLPLVEETRLIPGAAIGKLGWLSSVFEKEGIGQTAGFGLPHRHFELATDKAVVWRVTPETILSGIQDLNAHRHVPFILKIDSSGRVHPLEYFDLSSIHNDPSSAEVIATGATRLLSAAEGLALSGQHNMFTLTLMPTAINHFLSTYRELNLLDIMAYEQSDERTKSSWLTFSNDPTLGSFDSLWVFRPNGSIIVAGQCTPTCNTSNC